MAFLRTASRQIFQSLLSAMGRGDRRAGINIVAPGATREDTDELIRRATFFFPPQQIANVRVRANWTSSIAFSAAPILLFGGLSPQSTLLAKLHSGVYDVDWRSNPEEGWNWIDAATWSLGHSADIRHARSTFHAMRDRLSALGLDRCYLFGTGPSLGAALQRDWSDGIRIVCNTIVRDAELWHHVQPHVIVAGDGIYHFGFTPFAIEFRRDLRKRLAESPSVNFVYPARFDVIVRREFPDLHSRLIPLPIGTQSLIHECVNESFELPALGNVLNLLLLPLGCALSHRVALWGFDGRAPVDTLFWSNSARHSYAELLPSLQKAHPAFFDHHVPKQDPEKYLRSVHGNVLEHALTVAEQAGWSFEMLHATWTTTLAKRVTPGIPAEPQLP